MPKFNIPGLGLNAPDAPSTVEEIIVGTDPGGAEIVRVGGNARVSGYLTVGGGVTRRGNGTYPGMADDITPTTVANLGTIAIGDGGSVGFVFISENNGALAAIVLLRGGFHAVVIANAVAGTWGTVLGAGNNHNVYWDAGTATYRIENRSGTPTGYFVDRVGQFTS